MFHAFGVVGLAWASDIGIGVNLLALAWLLHRKKLVPLGRVALGRVGKGCAGLAVVAGGISFEVAKVVPLAAPGMAAAWRIVLQLALGVGHVGGGGGSGTVAAALGVAGGFAAAQGSGVSGGGAGGEQGDFGCGQGALAQVQDLGLRVGLRPDVRKELAALYSFSGAHDDYRR